MVTGSKRLWFAAAAILLLIGCDGPEERAASYLEAGKERFASGDLDRANVEFRNVLQIDPKNVEARYHIGLIAERKGSFSAAFKTFSAITTEKPDHVEAQAKVGQFYVAAGRLDEAREYAKRAQELDPDHPEVVLLEASLLFREGAFDQAEERARTALATAPDDVSAIIAAVLLARTLREAGETEKALTALDESIEHVANPTMLRTVKVQFLLEADRFEKAVEEYRKLVEANPDDYRFRLTLARLHVRKGQMDAAQKVLRNAIADGVGGSQPKLHLVDVISEEDGAEAAEAELVRLIEASPDEHTLRLRLAGMFFATDRAAQAEDVLKEVMKADGFGPHGIDARLGLARVHLSRNERDAANRLVGEILENDPNNGAALFLRASIALTAGDTATAIADLRSVLRNQPSATRALVLLERAYLQAGELELAEETVARTIELDPRDTASLQRLALLKAQRGDRGGALALLERVEKAGPDAPIAAIMLQTRAALLLGEKKWEEAEWAIRQLSELPDQKPRARYLTGVMDLLRGRQDDAVAAFEEAYSLASTAVEPVSAIVRTHLSAGRPEEAVAFLEGAIEAQPNSPILHNFLGEVQIRRGEGEAASTALEKAKDLAPQWEVPYVNLARVYIRQGDPEGALAIIDEGLKKRPDHPLLLIIRGESENRLGRNAEAIATFLSVANANPDNLLAANNAAALIADHAYDDPALLVRAQELIRRLEDIDNPRALDTIGWVHYRAGAFEVARSYLERAVAAAPDEAQLRYHLGMALYRIGETDAAKDALTRALAEGVDYPGIEEARTVLAQLQQG